jgi:hypothetical protein
MWQDRNKSQVSGVAVALFAISGAAGLGLATALENRALLIAGLLVDGGIHPYSRHRARECRRHRVLAGLER